MPHCALCVHEFYAHAYNVVLCLQCVQFDAHAYTVLSVRNEECAFMHPRRLAPRWKRNLPQKPEIRWRHHSATFPEVVPVLAMKSRDYLWRSRDDAAASVCVTCHEVMLKSRVGPNYVMSVAHIIRSSWWRHNTPDTAYHVTFYTSHHLVWRHITALRWWICKWDRGSVSQWEAMLHQPANGKPCYIQPMNGRITLPGQR